MFSAFLTTKLLWLKPRSVWSAVEKLIKQQVNGNKAKETSSSCHCCGWEKNNNKRSPQLGNQSSVSYQEEEDRREEEEGNRGKDGENYGYFFVIFHGDLTRVWKIKRESGDIYDYCTDIMYICYHVTASLSITMRWVFMQVSFYQLSLIDKSYSR